MKTGEQISRFFIFMFGLLALAGCGGSGSSGFDALFAQEQQLIKKVDKGLTCEESNGTVFCSNVPVGDTLGLKYPFSMTISAKSDTSVSCVLETNLGPCDLRIGIEDIKNLESDTQYFMAVHYQAPFSSYWEIVPSPFVAVPSAPTKFEKVVPIRGVSGVTTGRVDLAVLAYPSGTSPTVPGTTETLLTSFKAKVAFVLTNVTVASQP
jgi:hypothetical protein